MGVEILEKKGAIRFLTYLLNQPGHSTIITRAVKDLDVGQTALYSTIYKLLDAGLVQEERSDKVPFTRRLILTDKGRRVAELLSQIEEVLKE